MKTPRILKNTSQYARHSAICKVNRTLNLTPLHMLANVLPILATKKRWMRSSDFVVHVWRSEYSLVCWTLRTCWKGGNWRLVVCLILLEILIVLWVTEEGGDILHLVMLLAHLLEPLMLSSLFGAEPQKLLVVVAAAVAINVHGSGSLGEFVVRDCFFGLP